MGRHVQSSTTRTLARCAGIVASVVAASAARADGPAFPAQVILSNLTEDYHAQVPGWPGVFFDDGITNQFGRPQFSADGRHFIIQAQRDVGESEVDNELVLTGTGSDYTAVSLVAAEGQPTAFDPSISYGNASVSATIRKEMGINRDGRFAFAATLFLPFASDDSITKGDPAGETMYGQEGAACQITGVATWGSTNGSIKVLDSGVICGRTSNIGGVASRAVLYRGGEVLCETSVTVPAAQLVTPSQSVKSITPERFRISADGQAWIAQVGLNGPTASDALIIKNNAVLAQEGATLPGSGFTSRVTTFTSDEASQQLSPNGQHVAFRGSNADGTDWVSVDGAVAAARGRPITTALGEARSWSDARYTQGFFMNLVNDNGETIIGGLTDDPDASRDAVLVWNGGEVVLREGDPIDVNGDGINDDFYIAAFNNDSAFFTNDDVLYFTADIKDAAGALVGQAFISKRISVPCPCLADFDQSGGTPDTTDITAYFESWLLGESAADTDCSGGTPDATDIYDFFQEWLAGGC